MNFNTKLLEIKDRKYFLLMDLIDELNKLRNSLVHDIDFNLESANMTLLDKILKLFPDYKVDEFSIDKEGRRVY